MKRRWSAGLVLMVSACATPPAERDDATSTADPGSVPTAAVCCEVPPPEVPVQVAMDEGEEVAVVEEAATDEEAVVATVQVDQIHGAPPVEPGPSIERWFQSQLAQPESAVFEFEEARRGHFGQGAAGEDSPGPRFGWVVPTWVQEGNDNPTLYHCWFRGARLIAVVDPARMPSTVEVAIR